MPLADLRYGLKEYNNRNMMGTSDDMQVDHQSCHPYITNVPPCHEQSSILWAGTLTMYKILHLYWENS